MLNVGSGIEIQKASSGQKACIAFDHIDNTNNVPSVSILQKKICFTAAICALVKPDNEFSFFNIQRKWMVYFFSMPADFHGESSVR